ncbi:MAG TPA: hypothetical protein VGE01_11300 [Fimbriimonas sp.]
MRISAEEAARRALILDFEGPLEGAPMIAGLNQDGYEVLALDPRLKRAARSQYGAYYPGPLFIDRLRIHIENGGIIAAYSQHELNKLRDQFGLDVRGSYCDVKKVMQSFGFAHGLLIPPCLSEVEDLFGIRRRSKKPNMTAVMREVAETSSQTKWFKNYPAALRAQWRRVVYHNRQDCKTLSVLLDLVARADAALRVEIA